MGAQESREAQDGEGTQAEGREWRGRQPGEGLCRKRGLGGSSGERVTALSHLFQSASIVITSPPRRLPPARIGVTRAEAPASSFPSSWSQAPGQFITWAPRA